MAFALSAPQGHVKISVFEYALSCNTFRQTADRTFPAVVHHDVELPATFVITLPTGSPPGGQVVEGRFYENHYWAQCLTTFSWTAGTQIRYTTGVLPGQPYPVPWPPSMTVSVAAREAVWGTCHC